MTERPELLTPTPKRVRPTDERLKLGARLRIDDRIGYLPRDLGLDADPALARLGSVLRSWSCELAGPSGNGRLRLVPLADPAAARLGPEGYTLRITDSAIELAAGTGVGVGGGVGCFRGLTTLVQWLELHESTAHGVRGVDIEDRPDFRERGVLLDVSRNRVPRMSELEATIDLASRLKLNQLQLYTEHTFAYGGHETVWQGWSPFTADEIRHVAAYAAARHIRWVPNQNSFGHMHRWLVHPAYRPLAESPEGIVHPFSPQKEPFSLCPTDPGSLRLLEDLYDQLLPLTDEPLFNANLDETLDLGQGRSRRICAERGTERVYLDFVHKVHRLAARHGKRMMMWGDIILKRPELVDELPEDLVLLEWGYEADHPFDEDCARFAASGRELYVCPGTGSWSTFGGRTENTWTHLKRAAVHGHAHGAVGFLLTDWGDHGHLQPPMISYPGLLAGAALSWTVLPEDTTAEHFQWGRRIDAHVLNDRRGGAGDTLLELGRVQDLTGVRSLNGGPLFYALLQGHKDPGERRDLGSNPAALTRTTDRLDELLDDWRRAAIGRPDRELLIAEAEWVAQALRLGADIVRQRLAIGETRPLGELDGAVRARLARSVGELQEALGPVWLKRSRPGGLDASIERLGWIRRFLEDAGHP